MYPSSQHSTLPNKTSITQNPERSLVVLLLLSLFQTIHATSSTTLLFLPPIQPHKHKHAANRRFGYNALAITTRRTRRTLLNLPAAAQNNDNESEGKDKFWSQQQELAQAMKSALAVEDETDARQRASLKEIQKQKFAKRQASFLSDTLYFSFLLFALLWTTSPDPYTPLSYLFGALLGTAYSFGLAKYVETLGESPAALVEGDANEGAVGAGLGQARFAFLILLFVFVGKFRSEGLREIPAIAGFFTYQLASLSQGLQEMDD